MTDLTQDELRKLALLCGWPRCEERTSKDGKWWHRGVPRLEGDTWRPMHDANHCLQVDQAMRAKGWRLQLSCGTYDSKTMTLAWYEHAILARPMHVAHEEELEARCRAALSVLDAIEDTSDADESASQAVLDAEEQGGE